jgi:RNA polymerase sigma-70 factor (ECF subfamily)
MSRPATSVYAQPTPEAEADPAVPADPNPVPLGMTGGTLPDPTSWGDQLLRTFNEARDELVSTLWFMLGNREDALDMAQEVFLRCWRAQAELPTVQNLRAWIFRVGLNAAKDLQRSAWRRRVKPLLGAEIMPQLDESPPTRDLEERESLEQLREALLHLRPEEQEVFLLRQNGELTYEQIAELSNRPIGTVKTQMRSALAKLRKVLAC